MYCGALFMPATLQHLRRLYVCLYVNTERLRARVPQQQCDESIKQTTRPFYLHSNLFVIYLMNFLCFHRDAGAFPCARVHIVAREDVARIRCRGRFANMCGLLLMKFGAERKAHLSIFRSIECVNRNERTQCATRLGRTRRICVSAISYDQNIMRRCRA